MAQILKGAPVAAAITERCAAQVEELKTQGIEPTLAILRVGEREDDLSYERGAMSRCAKAGIAVRNVVLDAQVGQEEMMAAIAALNADDGVHGILMFRPLPAQLDEKACCEAIAVGKDVDCATTASLASVFTGSGDGYAPCTAQACMEIVDHYRIDVAGRRVAVVGRSLVVGKPLAMLMLAANATPVICHSRTVDLAATTRVADVVVTAIGRCEMFGPEYFTEGQTVIDVGINWNEEAGKLCGDVEFGAVEPLVDAITPVPGGVGGVTTAVLASHVVEAAARRAARLS